MTGYVVFQMWGRFREHLIASHEFFVAEGRKRLLDQFNDAGMAAEADKFAECWLQESSAYFDPERHDSGDFYEQAQDESIAFYERLEDLRTITRLSIVAGMYHEWEKQLRSWLDKELMRLPETGEHVRLALWKVNIHELIAFLETWGWPVRTKGYYADLELCHTVVNVYKHGSGPSLTKLKTLAPDLAGHDGSMPAFIASGLDHTHLSISDAEIARFSAAIVAFWRDVPENTFDRQIGDAPAWLELALKKDLKARERSRLELKR